jgi:hypothetical protein
MNEGFLYVLASRNEESVLKFCLGGLRRNSQLEHKVVVCLNDSSDGSEEMLREMGVDIVKTHRPCRFESMNLAAQYAVAKYPNQYLFFSHNDCLPLPGWDTALAMYVSVSRGLVPNVFNINPKYYQSRGMPGCYEVEDPTARFAEGDYERTIEGLLERQGSGLFPLSPSSEFYRVFPPLLVDRVKFFECGQWQTDLARQVSSRLEDIIDRLRSVGVDLMCVRESHMVHFSWQASRNYYADNIDYRSLRGLSDPNATVEELKANLETLEEYRWGAHPKVGDNPEEYASIVWKKGEE